MRRRRSLLPVVILVGTASVGCASGPYFDSESGCCFQDANGTPPSYFQCRPEDGHSHVECDLCSVEPYACEDTGAETGDTDTAASAR